MSDKSKALSAALSQIERQFGKGSVMRMGDQKRERIPAISTGSLGLDIALAMGGAAACRTDRPAGPAPAPTRRRLAGGDSAARVFGLHPRRPGP